MIKYKVVLEITIADTDASPEDWLPPAIQSLLEDDETIVITDCQELEDENI
jgi:hypothetical protein